MLRYKPGDKVRVKTSLEPGERYNDLLFVSGMTVYNGKILTVSKIARNNWFQCIETTNVIVPELSEFMGGENYTWTWSEEMVEPYIAVHHTTENIESCIKKSDSFFDILSVGN